MITFQQFISDRLSIGGFSTEDTLVSFLPLAREVLSAHAAGMVAPLEGIDELHVEGAKIWFPQDRRREIRSNSAALRKVQADRAGAVEVIARYRRATEVTDGSQQVHDLSIASDAGQVDRPVYLAGYITWEHALGHQDPLTDIFSLGLILASLACGLDFTEQDALENFVSHRGNLFAIHDGLHPVLARAVLRMTELDRHRRAQDLAALIHSLEHYRDQPVELDFDLARMGDIQQQDGRTRQHVVLSKLRERLFEISRRNRLLQFRPSMQSANLTQASMPLSFDIRNIRADQILVWNDDFQKTLIGAKGVSLNKHLNFAEALYLPSVLDRIIAETRRDQAEFGFVQLRLAVCFLHWANLKEEPVELYDSPLVLLPVELKKKKGIRDTYQLRALDRQAEINPVVRYQFKQLYDIDLPAVIDLDKTNLDAVYSQLVAQIERSSAEVSLEKIDKPRIALIHDKARRKLDQYRRRARIAGRGVRSFMDLDYSYDPANYHPLGIKLFTMKIKPGDTHLRRLIEQRPRSRNFVTPEDNPPTVEKEKLLYSLQESGEGNPYAWSFDQCSVTLANFRYRKMSLVRDYEALLDDPRDNPAFDATFSLSPRPIDDQPPQVPPLVERFDVVPCDPTQAAAIQAARGENSYIIQGPPGTGKSQTITNLIADYVSAGKRVLFVCEKRAAIDVVYARLRHCGLADQCCLIHDSQSDKKQFVMDLERTYESYLQGYDDSPAVHPGEPDSGSTGGHPATAASAQSSTGQGRATLLERMQRDLQPLEQFTAVMQSAPEDVGTSVRQLLARSIELADKRPALSPVQQEQLPSYAEWSKHRAQIESYARVLSEICGDGVLARHPLAGLSMRLVKHQSPLRHIATTVDNVQTLLVKMEQTLDAAEIPFDQSDTLDELEALFRYAGQVQPVAAAAQMPLLDSASKEAAEFDRAVAELERRKAATVSAGEMTVGWRTRLSPDETNTALLHATALHGKAFAFLSPAWWRLRKVLKRNYDFRIHEIKPSWLQVLSQLKDEHDCAAAVEQQRATIARDFHVDGDVDDFARSVHSLRKSPDELDGNIAAAHRTLASTTQSGRLIGDFTRAGELFTQARKDLADVMDTRPEETLAAWKQSLADVQDRLDDVPALLDCLREICELPTAIRDSLRQLPLAPLEIEAAVADRSLAGVYRTQRDVARFTTARRDGHAKRLQTHYDAWLRENAEEIRNRVKSRFLDNLRIASLPASQLGNEQREFKKRYNRGRRELEHEFGKSMRYKSIRDLVANESGDVVKDLKPVWLMSPLSVSDTLPLDTDHVDVVIFDEASQITLEEAVPSLFRAAQCVVVGDEMQLPPTDFFSSKQSLDEDELLIDNEGELVQYDLESNSFLNHASKNLQSTMLGWHYRSRSESLISFSNWAFYQGRLLSVPEERLPPSQRQPLEADAAEDAVAAVDELSSRAISFHFMKQGIYDKRRNRTEAEYIAELVRELLRRQSGLSIGVVAFSEAQQEEIQMALERLAQTDEAFGELLAAEFEREEDDQFVGLLVKNLENIQGDERDIVILSVCYGPAPNGKMLMNFGPINKSGGEKRLNVAFSRAKHHMALVSSIKFAAITNDYNEGANCLKNYLRYAEAVSLGDNAATHRLLQGLAPQRGESGSAAVAQSALAQQLSQALQTHGLLVDHSVGQSHFRCDLALRREGDTEYRLGVLLDQDEYYAQQDLLERDMMRPRLLRNFGWRIAHVLAKDWYANPDDVLQRLLRLADSAE